MGTQRSDGGRQFIGFPIPGDCVGLRSVLLWTSDHSFSAVTDVVVCPVAAPRMLQIFNEFPRLGSAFLWSASRDEAMLVEHLVNIGRRNALERTAHLFMELAERLMLVGLATETEFKCPLSRYVLADALGLSAIHVNRVLRELRELKLLTVKTGKVIIHDLPALRKLAGYQSVNGRAASMPAVRQVVRRSNRNCGFAIIRLIGSHRTAIDWIVRTSA